MGETLVLPDQSPWHSLPSEEALERLAARAQGLSATEATARLDRFGRNEVPRRKPVSPLRLLVRQFANFFVLVLLFAAALALVISFLPQQEDRRLTGYFVLGIVVISVALSFFEEYRAQQELQSLDRLLRFQAVVLRDGNPCEIDAAEVVPGDVLVLSTGRKVAADARVIGAHSLRADESALTGESAGVDKSPDAVPPTVPLAERISMVYGSTYVTHGSGLAVVVRTGMSTEVGQIAATLEKMAERPTPFQVEVRKMGRQMTWIVGSLAVVVGLVLYFLLHDPPVDVALGTLSLAVATIPESLPIVLTFALALGARQMAVRRAVVRRLSVVESLGSVDTICTDKTGTLTENRMTVQRLFADGQVTPGPRGPAGGGAAAELLRAGTLCNEAVYDASGGIIGDPVDAALLRAALEAGLDVASLRAGAPRVDELPFSSERKRMTTIHEHAGRQVGYTKGALGAVLPLCDCCWHDGQTLPLGDDSCQRITLAAREFQREGMYVLALARKELDGTGPATAVEQGMTLLGLVALLDPPRPEVAGAIAQAQGAGIRVVMITGDNGLTAQAVARELGIGERTVEARELEGLSRPQLLERIQTVDIVARATPQAKQEVLQALQDAGHFVAMTGDGVNDATALKQADVGVAMGMRGTDIAKESADMVLLDDNFATIVAAVEEGRRTFDNIRKFTNYLLSTSLGEVFVVLALSLAGYFPLSAVMLLWVNVVTDLVPASALASDPAVPQIMRRRPRRHDEPILNKALYATIAGSVLRTLVAYSLIFWAGLQFGGASYARTMLFTSIVLHAFTRVMVVRQLDNLTLRSNPALLWSYAAAVGLQLLALYTPLRNLFGVLPLDWRAWAVMIPVTSGSSLAGVYMTRWILRWLPLWTDQPPA
jgi:Ca2+-transporting ATPase